MVMLVRWYFRRRLQKLERLMGDEFNEELSKGIDACVAVIEALEALP
jgi:hypothetical protein